jgi:replicative DNA helicase
VLEQTNLEHAILGHLLYNKDYADKVLRHIKKDYFQERVDQTIFAMISGYIHKYNRPPSKEMLDIELLEATGISDEEGEKVEHVIASLHQSDDKAEWIIDKTEEWIAKRLQYLAISKLIKDNVDKTTAITELQDALNFTFNEGDDLTSFEDSDINYWKEANYIIKELVPSSDGDVGVISGESQVGKTFLVVNMMAHIVNGVPWAGKRAKACSCLYVAGEASKGIEKRVHGHKSAYPDMTFRNEKLGTRAYFKADRLNMANPKDQNKLKAWIKKTGAKFVVLDTLSTMLKGSDSKDEDVKPFINGMISVAKETGATIVVTHHPSKNGQSKQK